MALIVFLLSFFMSGFMINDTFAAIDVKSIKSKAVYEGVYGCRNSYNMSFQIYTNHNYSLAKGNSGVSFNRNSTALIKSDGSESAVKLPYDLTAVDDNTLNCKQILVGFSDFGTNSTASEDDKLSQGLIAPKYHQASVSTTSGKQSGNVSSVALDAISGNQNSGANTTIVDIVKYLAGGSLNGSGGIGFKATQSSDNSNRYDIKSLGSNSASFAMDMIKGLNSKNTIGYKLGTLESYSDLALTAQEVADLYSYYLIDEKIYGVPVACDGDSGYDSISSNYQLAVGGEQCRLNINESKTVGYPVYGVNSSNHFGTSVSAKQAFDKIKELVDSGQANLNEMGALIAGGSVADGSGEEGESEKTCTSAGGGGALGWILCPVLNFLSGAAEKVYSFVEPYLDIDPDLFTVGDGGSTQTAWETFRNLANIVFIILLLVVIFSQLTGVGIDNYGIKKIMPKLILSAVLINASYLICVLAVDLSNIIGNGISLLFENLPAGTPAETVEGAPVSTSATLVSVGVLGIAGVGAFMAFLSNPAVLLSLLVAALGVVIALFFLFILLAAREAVVVVLVVISPLAFASMMLPNTKKSIFDKWKKAAQAMLLLYPICGLMIGGGNYVSRLLMSANGTDAGFMTALMAMLAGIVPIFFIPMVLKNAFAAFGSIGTKLSGLGDRVRGGATRSMRNSNGYKGMQERGLEFGTMMKSGLRSDGRPSSGARRALGRVLSGGNRNRQRNALKYRKIIRERGSLEAADAPHFMDDALTENVKDNIIANGWNNDENRMMTGLQTALMQNNAAEIRAYTDLLSANGESGREKVKKAYNNVASNINRDAAETFANNILANHAADYKANHRSLFEVASSINGGKGETTAAGHSGFATTDDYLAGTYNGSTGVGKHHLIQKAKAGTLGSMDDQSFAETFLNDSGAIDVASIDGALGTNWSALGENIDNALKNQDKMDTRRVQYLTRLRQYAIDNRGYKPAAQRVKIVPPTSTP